MNGRDPRCSVPPARDKCLQHDRARGRSMSAVVADEGGIAMIRKLPGGQYRLYSRKVDPRTGKRRNLGTFDTRSAAEKHEREVQYFKRH